MYYQLTAVRGDDSEVIGQHLPNDGEATIWAIRHIMDEAIESDLWAKGHITLETGAGDIVAEMDSKG